MDPGERDMARFVLYSALYEHMENGAHKKEMGDLATVIRKLPDSERLLRKRGESDERGHALAGALYDLNFRYPESDVYDSHSAQTRSENFSLLRGKVQEAALEYIVGLERLRDQVLRRINGQPRVQQRQEDRRIAEKPADSMRVLTEHGLLIEDHVLHAFSQRHLSHAPDHSGQRGPSSHYTLPLSAVTQAPAPAAITQPQSLVRRASQHRRR